ncbi:MAG: HlyD family efflux transporter periplasmic adaptor subunit [Legionellales bacterium]|nr:HlyD family efflux transporter periplasmic adaptor subunit [Legionellales bacterium]
MEKKHLFRPEVIEALRNKNYGSVSINSPVHYWYLTLGLTLLMLLTLLFLVEGEFSEKFIVSGYLESTQGVARVYPSKNGVIVRQYVQQGDLVHKGDDLFLIDTSYEGLSKRNQHDVWAQLEKRKASLVTEIGYSKKHLQALKPLLDKRFISETAYHEKHDELRELELKKNMVVVDMITYQHEQSYVIRSPIDGTVSSLIYQEGQYTQATKPLLKILPIHAELMAQLFIPVKQSGFINHKDKVTIRYDAYPYARFGVSKARVHQISQSILTDEEEDKPIRIGEPYYKVTALLEKPFVTVYGVQKKIQHGMTISAVVVGSKKRIWQWILDPLYSFYGDVFV